MSRPASGKSKGKEMGCTQRPFKAHKQGPLAEVKGGAKEERRSLSLRVMPRRRQPPAELLCPALGRCPPTAGGESCPPGGYNSAPSLLLLGSREKRRGAPGQSPPSTTRNGTRASGNRGDPDPSPRKRAQLWSRLLAGLPAGCAHCRNRRCLPGPATAARARE